jgi:hypothetical protein
MKQRGGTPPDKSPGNPPTWLFLSQPVTISDRYELVCSIETITEVRHVLSCSRLGFGVGPYAASHPDPTIFRS